MQSRGFEAQLIVSEPQRQVEPSSAPLQFGAPSVTRRTYWRPSRPDNATRAASSETAVGVHEPVSSFGSPVSADRMPAAEASIGGTTTAPGEQSVIPAGAPGSAKSMSPN